MAGLLLPLRMDCAMVIMLRRLLCAGGGLVDGQRTTASAAVPHLRTVQTSFPSLLTG